MSTTPRGCPEAAAATPEGSSPACTAAAAAAAGDASQRWSVTYQQRGRLFVATVVVKPPDVSSSKASVICNAVQAPDEATSDAPAGGPSAAGAPPSNPARSSSSLSSNSIMREADRINNGEHEWCSGCGSRSSVSSDTPPQSSSGPRTPCSAALSDVAGGASLSSQVLPKVAPTAAVVDTMAHRPAAAAPPTSSIISSCTTSPQWPAAGSCAEADAAPPVAAAAAAQTRVYTVGRFRVREEPLFGPWWQHNAQPLQFMFDAAVADRVRLQEEFDQQQQQQKQRRTSDAAAARVSRQAFEPAAKAPVTPLQALQLLSDPRHTADEEQRQQSPHVDSCSSSDGSGGGHVLQGSSQQQRQQQQQLDECCCGSGVWTTLARLWWRQRHAPGTHSSSSPPKAALDGAVPDPADPAALLKPACGFDDGKPAQQQDRGHAGTAGGAATGGTGGKAAAAPPLTINIFSGRRGSFRIAGSNHAAR